MAPTPPTNGRVTSPFGMRVNPNDGKWRMHYGEDTIGVGNYAPCNGVVVFADYDRTGTGLGWAVGIQQNAFPNVIWWVAHHGTGDGEGANPIAVKVGEQVVQGRTYLGPKGDSGAAQGPHCHTERREGGSARPGTGTAKDPRKFYTGTSGGGIEPIPEEEDDMQYTPVIIDQHRAGKNDSAHPEFNSTFVVWGFDGVERGSTGSGSRDGYNEALALAGALGLERVGALTGPRAPGTYEPEYAVHGDVNLAAMLAKRIRPKSSTGGGGGTPDLVVELSGRVASVPGDVKLTGTAKPKP